VPQPKANQGQEESLHHSQRASFRWGRRNVSFARDCVDNLEEVTIVTRVSISTIGKTFKRKDSI